MKLPFDRTERRRIYLMRHAEAEYVRPDGSRAPDSRVVPLTSNGRAEAETMGAMLEGVKFDRAICSGLPRTRETASFVLASRNLKLEIVPELEEIRGGDAVARANLSPVDYAYGMFRAMEPDACYAGGEKFLAFADRTRKAFHAILTERNWTCLLLVAHGGVNRAILTDITGSALEAFGTFEQDSCCLNVIDIDTCLDTGNIQRKILRGVNITANDPSKQKRLLTTLEGMTQRFVTLGHMPAASKASL